MKTNHLIRKLTKKRIPIWVSLRRFLGGTIFTSSASVASDAAFNRCCQLMLRDARASAGSDTMQSFRQASSASLLSALSRVVAFLPSFQQPRNCVPLGACPARAVEALLPEQNIPGIVLVSRSDEHKLICYIGGIQEPRKDGGQLDVKSESGLIICLPTGEVKVRGVVLTWPKQLDHRSAGNPCLTPDLHHS